MHGGANKTANGGRGGRIGATKLRGTAKYYTDDDAEEALPR